MTDEANNERVFKLAIDSTGYSIETNLSEPEIAYWLGILHVKYAVGIVSNDVPA